MISDPAKWQRVKEILADALELDVPARDSFVRAACGTDQELLVDVRDLLANEATTELDGPTPAAAVGARKGRRMGPYVLQHRIGEGGVGQVWAASRVDDVHMRVAMKLLRSDREDEEQFQRRFRAEMQILALLRHPHIVAFLDAGTGDNGQPYFAMEYVEGEPITTYCSRRRLSVEQRLQLFLQVCEAVQYAHKYALLHRDLKPSNILVTADGAAKLLDFGIAKLLRPEILGEAEVFTRPNTNPMTPEYASPEQLTGGVLTTATDIYSLGIVLFEMLTGRTPFSSKDKGLLQFQKLVVESDPPQPSTAAPAERFREFRASTAAQLRRTLHGDLDQIVLMAIRREPDRRYETVAEFADDIRRHLDGLAVRAHADSVWYRTRKFVKRRRVEVIAVAAVFVSLAVGLGEAIREKRQAQVERDRAEARLHQLKALAQSFESTFQSFEEASRPGAAERQKLGEAEQDVVLQPSHPELQAKLAQNYEVIAEALGSNGQRAEAERMAQKAVSIRELLVTGHPADTLAQSALAAARALLDKIRSRGSVYGATPSASGARINVVASPAVVSGYEQLGQMQFLMGNLEGAIRAYSAAARELALDENVGGTSSHRAKLYAVLSDLYASSGNVGKAEEYRRAAERLK